MLHLFDLVPEDEALEAVRDRLVVQRDHPSHPLSILNYTDKAQVNNIWTRATKTFRGVIFDRETLEVVARPFPKFFNHGQEPAKHRRWREDEMVIVTDKLDGSLGILYPLGNGRHAISTRGSFESEQALHATAVFERDYAWRFSPEPGKTYLYEIIYPENRIVVDYGGMDDLVLLGVVDIETGITYSAGGGRDYGWPGPTVTQAPYKRFRDALAAPPRPGKEGMVVHFLDSDARVKLKQDDYIALHKIVTGLSKVVVWEHMSEYGDPDMLLESLPDEFHPWVKDVAEELFWAWFEHDHVVESVYSALEEAGLTGKRKEFALSIKDKPAWLKAALFAFLDRNYSRAQKVIWQNIKPKGGK
ncbi:Hypothetical protein AJAP_27875 [Amycolatopsis japonica]|uniref:T4 RNA ligase 1-like N-terminal domain-containing protein n=1 Tax=Amycolatopsis japonica TaxID=208439 RepID=A0A075V1F1_9PSEU|nr:RNA ligase [Amycolatopsis japonica]AIG78419.1 Hypothetical protein AJAP_27875 [Amycolatopsis japonica]